LITRLTTTGSYEFREIQVKAQRSEGLAVLQKTWKKWHNANTPDEIIEEVERQPQKFGGERSEWCVGTAKDPSAPFFRRHLTEDLGDGFIYRAAFTTSGAQEAIDHLVKNHGPHLDRETVSELGPEPGRLVFAYRKRPTPNAWTDEAENANFSTGSEPRALVKCPAIGQNRPQDAPIGNGKGGTQ
jgi:hypothetical protein